MNLLQKRPLATTLIVLLGGFSAFSAASTLIRVLLCLSLGILWLVFTLWRGSIRRVLMHTLFISCAISFLLSFLYFDVIFPIGKQYEDAGEVTLTGYVKEVVYSDGYFTVAHMQAESIDTRKFADCMVAISSDSGTLGDITPGMRLCVRATLSPCDTSDGSYTIGSGIRAEGTICARIDKGELPPHKLTVWQHRTTQAFSNRMSEIADKDSSALMSALILGDRQMLPNSTALSFSRIGITHLLALSGLHLSILSLLFVAVLSLFRVNKCVRKAVLCVFVIAYILLTGAPSSLLRAGIMLIVTSLLFLLRQSYDSVTTLCLTIVLICTVTPYAVFDLALWLSALSTLGILLLGNLQDAREAHSLTPWWQKPIRALWQSVLLSVSAQSAALLLSVLSFDTLSILSPFSTFLFGTLIQVFMYFGLLTALLGGALPFLGDALTHLGSFITDMAHRLSDGRFVLVDAAFDVVHILTFLFTLLLVLFILCRVQRKRLYLSILGCLFASVFLCAFSMTYHAVSTDKEIYFTAEASDGFVITSNGETALIDISTNNLAFASASSHTLKGEHILYLDAYILTRYVGQSYAAVRSTLAGTACRCVYLPTPTTDKEAAEYAMLLQLLEQFKVPYASYDPTVGVHIGEMEISMPHRNVNDHQTNLWLTLTQTDTQCVYFSRGSLSKTTQAAAGELTTSADTVIFGCCGYATDYILDITLSDTVKVCILADKQTRIREDRYRQYEEQATVILRPVYYRIKH